MKCATIGLVYPTWVRSGYEHTDIHRDSETVQPLCLLRGSRRRRKRESLAIYRKQAVFADSTAQLLAQIPVDEWAMEFARPRSRTRPWKQAVQQELAESLFSKPILPGFPTSSTSGFNPSFLRSYRPTSQEVVERQPPQDGRSRSSRILGIQAFENSFLGHSLPPLARDEILTRSLSSRA